ncbi:MAG: STAS domain-containing protein [Pirellulaceae bacterium]|nr:STAS domain-containing protein [Pirellulaceae bacterium]
MNSRSDDADSTASATLKLQEKRLIGYMQGLDLRQELLGLLEKGYPEIVVDMASVELISSSIIGTLVGLERDFRLRDVSLVLTQIQPPVHKILTTTGVIGLFKIRDK